MSRRRRRLVVLVVALPILLLLLALFIWAAWPGRSTFTVSPETTYVTGPLDGHGYVDYVSTLNERLSKGITPENNANVLIWKALGPHPQGVEMPAEYFKWLGIDPPPEKGEYFVPPPDHLALHPSVEGGDRQNDLQDRLEHAAEYPWSAKDDPELANWLVRKESCLALTIEATRRSEFFNPLVPKATADWSDGLYGSLFANVQECRQLARGLACRAMLRVSEGKTDEAWGDLLACHRLGRLLARGGSLIEQMVGIEIDRIASDGDLVFLDHTKVASTQLLQYRRDLETLPPMSSLAETMDLAERFMFLDVVMLNVRHGTPIFAHIAGLESKPPKPNSFTDRLFTRNIDYDTAMLNGNRLFDRIVKALSIAPRSKREKELDAVQKEIAEGGAQVLTRTLVDKIFAGPKRRGELIGKALVFVVVPAYRKVQDMADRHEQTLINLRLAFALAAFRADSSHFPATLNKLAPKYLDKIPNDLFSDKPLIYKPSGDGYLLYSVGPNASDDGGRGDNDQPTGDDITVRMPVPTPHEKK